jgi:hypothetical protein
VEKMFEKNLGLQTKTNENPKIEEKIRIFIKEITCSNKVMETS